MPQPTSSALQAPFRIPFPPLPRSPPRATFVPVLPVLISSVPLLVSSAFLVSTSSFRRLHVTLFAANPTHSHFRETARNESVERSPIGIPSPAYYAPPLHPAALLVRQRPLSRRRVDALRLLQLPFELDRREDIARALLDPPEDVGLAGEDPEELGEEGEELQGASRC